MPKTPTWRSICGVHGFVSDGSCHITRTPGAPRTVCGEHGFVSFGPRGQVISTHWVPVFIEQTKARKGKQDA